MGRRGWGRWHASVFARPHFFKMLCPVEAEGRRRARCRIHRRETLSDLEVAKEAAQICVVRLGLETQLASVSQIGGELRGQSRTKLLDGHRHFDLTDLLVLVLARSSLLALPWQLPLQKVDKHVPKRLEVVATALFDTEVRIDSRVPNCTRQSLVFAIRNVLVSTRVTVSLGQA